MYRLPTTATIASDILEFAEDPTESFDAEKSCTRRITGTDSDNTYSRDIAMVRAAH
jgi:hypothetical protein